MPYLGLLHPEPLPLHQATADLYLSTGDTHTLNGRSGSVSVKSPGEHRFCLNRAKVSGGYGVWF